MTPTVIQGKRIVRLRQVRIPTGWGPNFVKWGVFDLRAGSRAKPLYVNFIRQGAARWVDEQGWRYVGSQENVR